MERLRALQGTSPESDAYLALIARSVSALIWTTDRNLVIRSSTGFPATLPPVDGASLFDVFGIDDDANPAVVAHRQAIGGELASYEMTFRARLYRVSVAPRRDPAFGRGVTAFATDMTDDRSANVSLRRSEETLALAQAAAHLGSWHHDYRTDLVTWSAELFALCGLGPEALVPEATTLRRFVHPDDRIALEAALEFACEERRAFVIDTRLIAADGTERWVQHRGSFSYDGEKPTRIVGTVLDITGRKRAEDNLAYQANYDELTGLPNRQLLGERLQRALLDARHDGVKMAVLCVDLDRFKAINDTLGHAAGDNFLRGVAPRLLGVVREADTVARSGGDQFVVLLPQVASLAEAAHIAERTVAAFSEPIAVDGRELYSSASVGVSIFPDDGDSPEQLLRAADAALQRAKQSGHGSYGFYTASTSSALDRLELEDGIRRALDREEFVLDYQPIVDRFERPVAVEVLVRWEHPKHGTILPDRFIPTCEETGLIVPLGRWVLRKALHEIAGWGERGLPPLRVAINVSARQMLDRGLPQALREAISETGVAAGRLELEITESVVMSDVASARRIIAVLKTLGVRVSLDDFGTGYSALSYLKHFSVDALKIDRAFVRDLPFDRGDAAIVSAVVALGHELELRVVAEGVETAEQAALVRRLGCDEMQGFHFARPLAAREVEPVLRAWCGVAAH